MDPDLAELQSHRKSDQRLSKQCYISPKDLLGGRIKKEKKRNKILPRENGVCSTSVAFHEAEFSKMQDLFCYCLFVLFVCLFLAAAGLQRYEQVFSGWGMRGLLSSYRARASHSSGFSCSTQVFIVTTHKTSSPAACGIFPKQRPNPCHLHRQVNT